MKKPPRHSKPKPRAKLNYQERVIATPHGLSANETDRAHTITYFLLDTLAQYQENFFAREYRKFWFELPPKEALARIDEQMSKSGVNVFTSPYKNGVIFNVHLAIYEYEGKKFLCPRMLIRNLANKGDCYMDGAPILIAPHCIARMLSRSNLQFADATKLLGNAVLQLMWAYGEEQLPAFNQRLHAVSELGIAGIGNLRCERIDLTSNVLCNGKTIIPAGKSVLLLKTWIDEKTLEEGHYENRGMKVYHLGKEL